MSVVLYISGFRIVWECLWINAIISGTWTSHYTVRDAAGTVVDEYDAVNEIALGEIDWTLLAWWPQLFL